MIRFWDETKFGNMSEVPDPDPPLDVNHGNRSRGGKLDVKLITRAIRSVKFWGKKTKTNNKK